MRVRETYRTALNCLPGLFKTKQKTWYFTSGDKGSLNSSVVCWPYVLLLECQLEGQAEAASWPWSLYSKIVLPLSCDTGVRSRRGLLPKRLYSSGDLFLHCNQIGFLFFPREAVISHSFQFLRSQFSVTSWAWLFFSLT